MKLLDVFLDAVSTGSVTEPASIQCLISHERWTRAVNTDAYKRPHTVYW